MFLKLSDAEITQLDALLTRAVANNQLEIGATAGNVIDDALNTDVPEGLSMFSVLAVGSSDYNGETLTVNVDYDGLRWLWARVQGARGGKKRKLTSEKAKEMAALRHKKVLNP